MEDLIKRINKKFNDVSLTLMNDESKEYCRATFSAANMQFMEIKGRTFCIAFTNEFNSLINEAAYLQSTENHPQEFGTGDAMDVLDALYESNINFNNQTRDRYIEYIKNEQFAYIVEIDNGFIGNKILRLDLFRQIESNKKDETKFDFTGGLFHIFKHYSVNDTNISTGITIETSIPSLEYVINKIIVSFFFDNLIQTSKTNFYSLCRYDDNYNLKHSFYYNSNADVYFIKTSHKIKRAL